MSRLKLFWFVQWTSSPVYVILNTLYIEYSQVIYKEFLPAEALRRFIKCYYIFEPGEGALFEDNAYATGCIEMMFNLGNGSWQINTGDGFITAPSIELWGQVIKPLAFRSIGNNSMFGVRFYPHAASIFLNEDVSLFNNSITDLADVAGKPVKEVYSKLQEATTVQQRILHLDLYFLQRLSLFKKKMEKTLLVNTVMNELNHQDFYDNIENVATRHGITSRYLQKIFIEHTGLTPKLNVKIHRFQNSLQLVAAQKLSLTSIAYECGYFDQSHFIREFKSFTGSTPSAFDTGNTSALLAAPNK